MCECVTSRLTQSFRGVVTSLEAQKPTVDVVAPIEDLDVLRPGAQPLVQTAGIGDGQLQAAQTKHIAAY